MPQSLDLVLAFSGGLDTSFCVPWLNERGYRVTTVFVDTGGTSQQELTAIEQRASALGAVEHRTIEASNDLWTDFVVPFVKAGVAYQDQYPLLCSDRYVIVRKLVETCRDLGTSTVAHGCTAMGNDQVRFDQTIRALGDFEIVAPIRDLQGLTDAPRNYEMAYLRERGHDVPAKTSRYTINENCLGVTISGSEIDDFDTPGPDTYCMTARPIDWPSDPMTLDVTFDAGVPVEIEGARTPGPEILQRLNTRLGAYGVGRGIYTGDTTIGLKGRIVFECPALTALLAAHRALEEAVLSKHQNGFKPFAARAWTQLVYEGLFHEPLRSDLEALIDSTQRWVSGTVTLQIAGGLCTPVAIDSRHLLLGEATYAQHAGWSAAEANGFIKLFGQSSTLGARRAGALEETQKAMACST